MGKRVFNTEFAPEEEIDGVKKTLDAAGIDYYEIRNSRLWLGGGCLCVSDNDDYERARAVIEEFQQSWREQARQNPVDTQVNWKRVFPFVLILIVFVLVTIQSLFADTILDL